MMQYVPRDILHQLLEHDPAGEFRWKDILDHVRIALSPTTMCDCLTPSLGY
jgi:hypothetical protein